jgi:hypothetical protein
MRHVFIGQFINLTKGYEASAVYESFSAGDTWQPVGDLKDDMIWDMNYVPSTKTLYAAGKLGLHKITLRQ